MSIDQFSESPESPESSDLSSKISKKEIPLNALNVLARFAHFGASQTNFGRIEHPLLHEVLYRNSEPTEGQKKDS